MLGRISKFAIGLIFIPVVIGVSLSFFESLTNIGGTKHTGSVVFLWGVLSYIVMHLFLFKPSYIYTFGHEMIHVLATWICGGGVKSFNISKKGGAVETTKSNFFISLSPYFIPIYTLILSLLYFIIPFFFKVPKLEPAYFFLAGFTLTLHLVFTAEVLKIKQPDILKTGYLFSLVVIYMINLILIAFILSLLFKGISFETFFYNTYFKSKTIYVEIFQQLFKL